MISGKHKRIFFLLLLSSLHLYGFLQSIPNTLQDYPVVITEIMADPSPTIQLPDVEYIEILNRSGESVNISGWTLTVGKYQAALPDITLSEGQYYIICDTESADSFSFIENIAPISMPPVLNTGQVISLKNSSGTTIHTVEFRDTWYKTPGKNSGGWSLEIIDPENPCTGYENWEASRNETGGTPGIRNSVFAHNPDLLSPRYIRAFLPSDSSVELIFSEPLNPGQASNKANYSVNNGFFHPETSIAMAPCFDHVLLTYQEKFIPGIHYQVFFKNTLSDCVGNLLDGGIGTFGEPSYAGIHDIIINEIMFETTAEKPEYIEIMNRSDRIIDLATLIICRKNPAGSVIESVDFSDDPWLLLPGQYYIITRNAPEMPKNCFHEFPGKIIESSTFIRLPDEEGYLSVMDTSFTVIDDAYYNRQMHDNLLENTHGVALERVSNNPSSEAFTTWSSASSASDYCTPAMVNSQLLNDEHSMTFRVYPDVISPDNDGHNDVLDIAFQAEEPGWKGTIKIYGIDGSLVKSIATNVLFGTAESFCWDGTGNNGSIARIGMYIVFAEIFNNQGKVKNYKKVVSVIRK